MRKLQFSYEQCVSNVYMLYTLRNTNYKHLRKPVDITCTVVSSTKFQLADTIHTYQWQKGTDAAECE